MRARGVWRGYRRRIADDVERQQARRRALLAVYCAHVEQAFFSPAWIRKNFAVLSVAMAAPLMLKLLNADRR